LSFIKEMPPINIGADISNRSFEIIESELKEYPKSQEFEKDELDIISRLIHTTTCFDQVLENIYFSKSAITNTQELLKSGAKVIVDVNMIKSGLSQFYLKEYENEVVCYINEPFTYESATKNRTTRSYAAVVEAIKRHKEEPLVLACGNAPTFIYAAINTLIDEGVDLSRVSLLLFPVGFVNVIESKEYARKFSDFYGVNLIMMDGRFGSSTMCVATLHALYKLINNFDAHGKYNGK
jgi:precorrin-8X/cobalt-precorrin-8 methylmutase